MGEGPVKIHRSTQMRKGDLAYLYRTKIIHESRKLYMSVGDHRMKTAQTYLDKEPPLGKPWFSVDTQYSTANAMSGKSTGTCSAYKSCGSPRVFLRGSIYGWSTCGDGHTAFCSAPKCIMMLGRLTPNDRVTLKMGRKNPQRGGRPKSGLAMRQSAVRRGDLADRS